MWAENAYEGRPPFSGSHQNPAEKSISDVQLEDFIYENISGLSFLEYIEDWGGVLRCRVSNGSQVALTQRGRHWVVGPHISLTVTLRVQGDLHFANTDGTPVMELRLITADGLTQLGDTLTVASISGTGTNIQSVQFTLRIDDTKYLALNGLQDGQQERVSVRLDLRNTESGTREIYLQEFRVETKAKPLVINSGMVVNGPVVGHGIRYTDTIKGFKTISPLEVSLYQGWDYGKNFSWPQSGSNAMGTQEIRGGPGIIRTRTQETPLYNKAADAVLYLELQAAQQAEVAAIVKNAVNFGYDSSSGSAGIGADGNGGIGTPGYTGTSPGSASSNVTLFNNAYATFLSVNDETNFSEMMEIAADISAHADSRAVSLAESDEGGRRRSNEFAGTVAADLREYADNILDAMSRDATSQDAVLQAMADNAASSPEDKWVEPHVDNGRLFRKGPNSATINLYNGAYDPLFYALQAHYIYNDTPSDTNEPVKRSAFVPPGHVGFMSPIDVPHGALLSELNIRLSVRPGPVFGVYTGMPEEWDSFTSGTHYRDLAQPGNQLSADGWEGKNGVLVEIWRHCLFAPQDDAPRYADPDFNHSLIPVAAELIFQKTLQPSIIELIGDNRVDNWKEPSLVGTSDIYVDAGKEKNITRNLNLLEDANEAHTDWGDWKSMLRADREHYSYFLIVRFMGGPRVIETRTDLGPYAAVHIPYSLLSPRSEYAPDHMNDVGSTKFEKPFVHYQTRQIAINDWVLEADQGQALQDFVYGEKGKSGFYGRYHPGPHVENRSFTEREQDESYGPQVKFRGARVGWLTDRGGDGGWGS